MSAMLCGTPVTFKQGVACHHDIEGGRLQRRINVPLRRRILGLQLRVAPRLLLVYVKLVICSPGEAAGRRAGLDWVG